MLETHSSICRSCHAGCAILVDAQDGKPQHVVGDNQNPIYHGYTCPKRRALPEQHANPARLIHSMRRIPDGRHEQIESEREGDPNFGIPRMSSIPVRIHPAPTTN